MSFDWRAHLPGLLRLVAALALAFTALGNWWSIDGKGANEAGKKASYDGLWGGSESSFDTSNYGESWYRAFMAHLGDHSATMHHVLPLIGVVGVVLAIVAQVVLLPGIAGGQLAPRVRFLIRAALCLPAIAACVIAPIMLMVTPESNVPAFAQVLLAMAAGFAIAGLDDERDALVTSVMRWGTVAFAALGALSQVAALIYALAKADDDVPAWVCLIIVTHYLLIAGVGALVAVIAATGRLSRALVVGLAAALTLGLLLRGWMQNDLMLTANHLLFQGPGLPFVVLAAALGSAYALWNRAGATAEPAHERWTSWTPAAFALAAVACTVVFILMVAARVLVGKASEEYAEAADKLNQNSREVADVIGFTPKLPTTGGTLWMAILLALLAIAYGLLAALVRRHAQGRLLAAILVPTLVLTTLITYAVSSVFGLVSLTFDAFALWLPLLATAALLLPPSVRAAAGPLLPRPAAAEGQVPAGDVQSAPSTQWARSGQWASHPVGQVDARPGSQNQGPTHNG